MDYTVQYLWYGMNGMVRYGMVWYGCGMITFMQQ
jgi:hypothetical protein